MGTEFEYPNGQRLFCRREYPKENGVTVLELRINLDPVERACEEDRRTGKVPNIEVERERVNEIACANAMLSHHLTRAIECGFVLIYAYAHRTGNFIEFTLKKEKR